MNVFKMLHFEVLLFAFGFKDIVGFRYMYVHWHRATYASFCFDRTERGHPAEGRLSVSVAAVREHLFACRVQTFGVACTGVYLALYYYHTHTCVATGTRTRSRP